MQRTIERMRKNSFEVVELDTGEQAKDYLLKHIPAGASVGVGGSISVRQIGVLPVLADNRCEVLSHWDVKPEDVAETRKKAAMADVYLTSANAVSGHGELVLIDGTGNRAAAVANGPKQVFFIVSRNKWVDGGYGAAVARSKRDACPPNARRLKLDTPCARTGVCDPEACGEDCMCRITLAVNRVPKGRTFTVVFVRETLGY